MGAINGIDVSHWQGSVDFNKVKAAGYKFVMLNAGYGKYDSQKDERFEENYKKAKAAGLGVGAYWYSYALTTNDALREAQCFERVLKGKQFDYPVAFDIEDRTQTSLSMAAIDNICTTFCGYMQSKGYYVSLYSYAAFFTNKVSAAVKNKYDIWVAHFDVSKPSYNGPYGMWQYTSSGRVNGVSGKCDCDYAYKDYPTLIKNAGKNGYSKPTKVLDTKGMKEGDQNLGVYYLKSLMSLYEARYGLPVHITLGNSFGAGTTKDVNYMLQSWGYSPNGIAGENFAATIVKKMK